MVADATWAHVGPPEAHAPSAGCVGSGSRAMGRQQSAWGHLFRVAKHKRLSIFHYLYTYIYARIYNKPHIYMYIYIHAYMHA